MSIVIIHGAVADNLRREEQLKQTFGCTRIIKEWDGQVILKDGDLVLTTLSPPFRALEATVISADIAKKMVTK